MIFETILIVKRPVASFTFTSEVRLGARVGTIASTTFGCAKMMVRLFTTDFTASAIVRTFIQSRDTVYHVIMVVPQN